MPLGFDRDANVINAGDSAEVYAYLTTVKDEAIPEADLTDVEFTIELPDKTRDTVAGSIVADGTGFVRYTNTDQFGEYKAVATFTVSDGATRSVRADFEVIDPFNPPDPTDEDLIGMMVWTRLEDLFDSEEGGPWLQDVTMATFKKEKMAVFIDEALFTINQKNPPTDLALGSFITNGMVVQANYPLLVEGVLVQVIRHLIRSYTEQPTPTGGQIVYEDRRDYLQRWQSVLEQELTRFNSWLALWKRQFLGMGTSKTLVSSKAGRLIPAPMRTRNIGRGYY